MEQVVIEWLSAVWWFAKIVCESASLGAELVELGMKITGQDFAHTEANAPSWCNSGNGLRKIATALA